MMFMLMMLMMMKLEQVPTFLLRHSEYKAVHCMSNVTSVSVEHKALYGMSQCRTFHMGSMLRDPTKRGRVQARGHSPGSLVTPGSALLSGLSHNHCCLHSLLLPAPPGGCGWPRPWGGGR